MVTPLVVAAPAAVAGMLLLGSPEAWASVGEQLPSASGLAGGSVDLATLAVDEFVSSIVRICACAATAIGAGFRIWDTQYIPSSKVFAFYREALSKVYMQWSPEFPADEEFHARVETGFVENGSITRHRCTPHVTSRTPADITKSTGEANYLVMMLSGGAEWVQGGRSTLTMQGDIVVIDAAQPAKVIMAPSPFDALVITIPRGDIEPACRGSDGLVNALLQRDRTPLRKCMHLIADRMISASPEELASLYNASVSLLPLEAGCFEVQAKPDSGEKQHYLLRAILDHIDQNIAGGELSPKKVAEKFGISARYVHKLFIAAGVTFCSHTTARRLDYIGRDLLSPACRQQPISSVAYRWGFNDLSSFNRAFRGRYGCTPSQFRMRAGG
jgi:AraC family transcriptional regulator, positive regulator of tynA and feaB